jgi:hypothetical protein
MNFSVNIWPITGLLLGVNYASTTDLDGEDLQHELQFALFVIIFEISWNSSQY